MNHATDLGWMIDASHNVKDPLEDLVAICRSHHDRLCTGLLVDRKKLNAAQEENDVVTAQEILQNAFRTDVQPIVAEARLRSGGALDPLQLFRE